MIKKKYLFLQSVSSPFFKSLARHLISLGHNVVKVNFNVGDWVYHWSEQNENFVGQSASQPASQSTSQSASQSTSLATYITALYKKYNVTDQVLFGDSRPLHITAIDQARLNGIKNHVFEEGYLRPYWITLEREGVNARSALPNDPDWYVAAVDHLPQTHSDHDVEKFTSPFWRRAWHDVNYHLAGAFNPLFYPHYRTHAQETAFVEYVGYVKRLPRVRWTNKTVQRQIDTLILNTTPYYFLPLQLNGDMQVRNQHVLSSMKLLLEYVLASFAQHAPSSAHLLIKNHPLDIGLINYPEMIQQLTVAFGLTGRIHFFESGDLAGILSHALGTVTLNSTVGMTSISQGCPTIALSDAIYNLPRLTFQNGLDRFWQERQIPDRALYACFEKVVMHTTQVNGGFYCPDGIRLAVKGSAARLTAEYSPLEALLQAMKGRER